MKAALLSACLLAASAAAQQPNRTDAPGPGTSAPASGNCGYTGAPGGLHDWLQGIYDEVCGLSHLRPPCPPIAYIESQNPFPAVTRRTGGRGESAAFETAVTQHLCELAHSEDEVAFVFAHELTHCRHGDVQSVERLIDVARASCPPRDDDCVVQGISSDRMIIEGRADHEAADLLMHSRFNAMAGADSMPHYRDLRWALGQDEELDLIHMPLSQRAEAIRDQVRAARGAGGPTTP